MISLAPGTKVFLACSPIDLRAGFNGLAAKVQQMIGASPFDGSLYIFRSKRGDYFKAIYWDGTGLWLLAKRLEKNRFVWPPIVCRAPRQTDPLTTGRIDPLSASEGGWNDSRR